MKTTSKLVSNIWWVLLAGTSANAFSEKLESISPEIKETVTSIQSKETLNVSPEILKEQQTILYLSYLTTLARLPENRDLDELFDWDIQLWEEEMFAIYGLIEILNGHNSIDKLSPPKSMHSDGYQWMKYGPDMQQDYNYDLEYKEVAWKNVINTISGSWFFPLNDTTLEFNYDGKWTIESMDFDRPRTIWLFWIGLNPNNNLSFKRDPQWRVDYIEVHRWTDWLNNDLVIEYWDNWKVSKIEQSKISPNSDKIIFEYDRDILKNMIYTPTFSIKHLTKANKIAKWWKNAIEWWKRVAEFTTLAVLKKMKQSDVIQVKNIDWLPVSSKAILHDSRWFWKEGFSDIKYDKEWKVEEVYREMSEILFDDKRKLTIEY